MTLPINRFSSLLICLAGGDFFGRPRPQGLTNYRQPMLTLPPARLEAIALFCIQEFRQFPPTQLVLVTFNREGQLTGTVRLRPPMEQLSAEQLLKSIKQTQATSVLVATLSPWTPVNPERFLGRVSDLLDGGQAQGTEVLDCLCIQGLNYRSLRAETDLWYAVCA